MTPEKRETIISSASILWNESTTSRREALDMLFEAVPVKLRPEWFSRLLQYLTPLILPSETITGLIEFAKMEIDDWSKVDRHFYHKVGSMLHEIRNASEQGKPIVAHIHMLAYYAGKQIVNAKGYPAPFDHNDLWLIPGVLEDIAPLTEDDDIFLESIWQILSNPTFIQLDYPVKCNPRCGICFMRLKKMSVSGDPR